jgi:hypothetical protein
MKQAQEPTAMEQGDDLRLERKHHLTFPILNFSEHSCIFPAYIS